MVKPDDPDAYLRPGAGPSPGLARYALLDLAGLGLVAFAVWQFFDRFPWEPVLVPVIGPAAIGLAVIVMTTLGAVRADRTDGDGDAGAPPSGLSGAVLLLVIGVLLSAVVLAQDALAIEGNGFLAEPQEAPPGFTAQWSPDALVLVTGLEEGRDYSRTSRLDGGWRTFGPATLTTEDGSQLVVGPSTPIAGRCPLIPSQPGNTQSSQGCFAQLGFTGDKSTVAWIKILSAVSPQARSLDDVTEVQTILGFDRLDTDAGLLIGSAGDQYVLHPDFTYVRLPQSGVQYPTFVDFDRTTGMVTYIEPVSFGG